VDHHDKAYAAAEEITKTLTEDEKLLATLVLAGADALRMVERAKRMMQQWNGWKNPFGDGRTGKAIIDQINL
jgi:hypothetical protein